jgi:hypothetical protein
MTRQRLLRTLALAVILAGGHDNAATRIQNHFVSEGPYAWGSSALHPYSAPYEDIGLKK